MDTLDRKYDVLTQGTPFCDLTFTFGEMATVPQLGQEVYASDFAVNPGGIFNIASALTALGLCVGLVAQMGNDMFSRFVAERMRVCGLPLDLVQFAERPLPVVTAGVSFPHDRLFISYAPPAEERGDEPRIDVCMLDTYRPRVLFTYGSEGLDVLRAARDLGILIFLDTAWDPAYLRSEYLHEVLQLADVAAPNLPEALEIAGTDSVQEALDSLSSICPCVVIKLGAEGAVARCQGEYFRVPALPVQARDTTGAGDNFNAGLIYGLYHHYPFGRALQCAVITGALSTQALGGCSSGYSAVDVEGWLRKIEGGDST